MEFFRRLLGRGAAAPSLPVRDWILTGAQADLEVVEVGPFATPEGRATCLDPLAFYQAPDWAEVPTSGGQLVVFHDPVQVRNSKAALVFGDGLVAGGAEIGVCAVDAGMASVFTPATHAATTAFYSGRDADWNPYDDFFQAHDDPQGGEHKIVDLPDGTPVPYIHSGWGDGGYPVATLTDEAGAVLALYVDFMGVEPDGAWLLPPGVAAR